MELCFYRGTGWFAALIRWWTKSPYAHAEFRFSDGRHWGSIMGRGSGWLSPSSPDTTLGVPLAPVDEERLAAWCESESGCPYDWRGIFFAQMLNRARSSKTAWFCSEACVAGMAHVQQLPTWLKPCTVSPGRLYSIWFEVRAGTPPASF